MLPSNSPVPSGLAAIPIIGAFEWLPPIEPWNCASPKLKMPPSEATLPVTVPIGGRGHPHNRLVEMLATHRAVEVGVAEAEDAAVCRHLPVTLPIGGGGHPDDGLVEMEAAH